MRTQVYTSLRVYFTVYTLHTDHDPSVHTYEGVRIIRHGNFRRENFRRREFSPPAIFAHRNFSRWEFSAPGIFIAGNFRRLEISPQIIFASNWKKILFLNYYSWVRCPVRHTGFPPPRKWTPPQKKRIKNVFQTILSKRKKNWILFYFTY